MPAKSYQYGDFNEIMTPEESARLTRTSKGTFLAYLREGMTPMGAIKQGYHYYKQGCDFKIIKDRLCELYGIQVKS